MRTVRFLVSSVVILALAACGGGGGDKTKTVEEVRKLHGREIEAKIAKMIAAAKLPAGTPSAPAVPLELRSTTKQLGDERGHPTNTIAVAYDELGEKPETEAEHKAHKFQFQSDRNNHVYTARTLLTLPPDYKIDETALNELLAARYVLIVSGRLSDGYLLSPKFVPGTADGLVTLVDLDTGTWLDQVAFTAKSSDTLFTSTSSTGSSDADEKIKRDLRDNTGKAIRDLITKKWPGAGVPVSWGY